MSWVATAIAGSTIVGAGASIYAGNKQASAAKSAANKSAQAQNNAADLQFKQYQQTRQDQEPWRVAGENALKVIQTQPDFQFTAENFDFLKDPGYDFVKQEGINALDRSAASRGRLLGGGQDRAVTRYATGLASNEYQNAFNRNQINNTNAFNRKLASYNTNLTREQSLAGIGQNATNLVSQAGQNMASNVASGAINSAAQQGNALIAGGNAQANAIGGIAQSSNQGIGNYLLYSMLK